MRSSQHHSDGGGRGGASGMNNQAEGGGAGGGESGVGWWRRCPWSAMECNGACVSRWCRRKPHWPTVLPILGVSWIIATFLTGFGMYMVICHAPTHDLHVFSLRSYQNNVSDRQPLRSCPLSVAFATVLYFTEAIPGSLCSRLSRFSNIKGRSSRPLLSL